MSQSIKAQRKGRNLYNYSTAGLGFKGTTRRNTFIGKDCIQNRLNVESYMRHTNYDGRVPTEIKKCTTLSRAIAVEEQRRRSDVPPLRARPGYLGAENGEAPSPGEDGGGGGTGGGGSPLSPAGGDRGGRSIARSGTSGGMGQTGDVKASRARDDATKTPSRVNWIDTRPQQAGPGQPQQDGPRRLDSQLSASSPQVPTRMSSEPQRGQDARRSPTQELRELHRASGPEIHHRTAGSDIGPRTGASDLASAREHAGRTTLSDGGGATREQREQLHRSATTPEGRGTQDFSKDFSRDLKRSATSAVDGKDVQHSADQTRSEQRQPLEASRAELLGPGSDGSREAPYRHSAPSVKPAVHGSQSQPLLLSPAAARRVTSPEARKDRPSSPSPRVQPGSDTGSPPSTKGGNSYLKFSTASTRSPRPGSSVFSDNPDNSRMSQALSSGGSQFGGIGERLDPKKWSVSGTVERSKKRPPGVVQSAHYEYIVEQLWKRRQEADETEREELDKELASLMHERRALSPTMSPRPPMSTAFTDRSLRRREGLGSRSALQQEDTASSGGAGTTPPQSDCGCIVCKPSLGSPAGQPSHSLHHNIQHYAFCELPASPQSPQTARQKSAPQVRRSPGSPNYDSNHMSRIFKEPPKAATDEHVDHLDEHPITVQMGMKVKSGLMRSQSADPRTAGRYRRKMDLDLETDPHSRIRLQGCVDPGARNEVAMVLSPRDWDPPRPRKITPCKKADGENKYKISTHSEKVSVHWNQPLYRFEVAAVRDAESPSRCNSLPSDYFLTFPPPGEGSPRRGEYREGSAGDYTPSGWGTHSRQMSPKVVETQMARVTNHELIAEHAARERSERLAGEQRFSDLCAFTEESSKTQTRELRGLKDRYTTRQSQAMADALAWQE